jgi:hypothetical protein
MNPVPWPSTFPATWKVFSGRRHQQVEGSVTNTLKFDNDLSLDCVLEVVMHELVTH